jgi:hypothetical protein
MDRTLAGSAEIESEPILRTVLQPNLGKLKKVSKSKRHQEVLPLLGSLREVVFDCSADCVRRPLMASSSDSVWVSGSFFVRCVLLQCRHLPNSMQAPIRLTRPWAFFAASWMRK